MPSYNSGAAVSEGDVSYSFLVAVSVTEDASGWEVWSCEVKSHPLQEATSGSWCPSDPPSGGHHHTRHHPTCPSRRCRSHLTSPVDISVVKSTSIKRLRDPGCFVGLIQIPIGTSKLLLYQCVWNDRSRRGWCGGRLLSAGKPNTSSRYASFHQLMNVFGHCQVLSQLVTGSCHSFCPGSV